ncbi:hypothetical protein HMPREF9141_1539 [Prevotella multiformis DSM 16608]|uniref:Uncharacterized protein n=1 Tax=Prevotella multiformis DSM 16608 TaxID=888743 RepID=F0F7H2_9BACT|nr:hypothetical protein HMPREF9141_1539 [Prevotella multiformis DSM 16608]
MGQVPDIHLGMTDFSDRQMVTEKDKRMGRLTGFIDRHTGVDSSEKFL